MPATLPIGTIVASGDAAHLTAHRFNRYTFRGRQSESGKPYALLVGAIVGEPAVVRTADCLTFEDGSDIGVPLRSEAGR